MDLPAVYHGREARVALIVESFARLLGRPLVDAGGNVVEALWAAPRPIVAHGTEADPVFFFGNRAALARFETTAEAFAVMPSRLSAEAPLREEREAFLAKVAQHGFVKDYSGIRISAKGQRFTIRDGIVWNLVDAAGAVHGQAATFVV